MKLKDLKVGTQLRLSLGIILAFVLLLGGLAWVQTDLIWQGTRGLYDHALVVRRALGELKYDVIAMSRGLKDLLLAEDDAEFQTTLVRQERYEVDAYQQFEVIFHHYLGPRQDVEDALEAFAQWKAMRRETIRLLQSGQRVEAMRRSKPGGVASQQAELTLDRINVISGSSQDRGDALFKDVTAHNQNLNGQIFFVTGVIIMFTSLIGYLLALRIRGPLDELALVARRFEKGELGARCGYVSGNEFGVLSAAFNRMASSIASQMQSRDTNQRISESFLAAADLPTFRQALLQQLVEITDSQMGAYYLRRPDDVFEPSVSIGVDSGRLQPRDASSVEGELARVLLTKKTVHLRDIPADAGFRFKTFTGEVQPREIISVPLVSNGSVRAVVSLASIRPYSAQALAVFDQPWVTLVGTVLANLLANDETRRLARELQDTNQELQAQQEELRAQTNELRKQAEEMQEQNVELEQQRLAVEEASRLKSAFLSNMSHELRTPLNSVLALSRVMLMQSASKLSAEEVNYLEIIERNGKNLLALINDLLDLAKIEAGKIDLRPRIFSLRLTLDNIMESMAPLAGEKQISLVRDIPEDLPSLCSDEVRVVQILQNLLANAVKFTDRGSVIVAAESDGEQVSIRVMDTGIGIAQEALGFIFDEFRQVDESSSRRHEGTGLGLAIARKAARMLGGDIEVQSVLGEGSTFILTLPLAWRDTAPGSGSFPLGSAAETPPSRSRPCGRSGGGKPLGNMRILLVEDNEAAVIQVRSVLESAGYAVDVARTGREAIAFVAKTVPDGIVLDLMMPEVDGFEVLEEIRNRPETATLPVLILTAKDLGAEDFKRLSANNVQQLVQKGDVDQASLLRQVGSMLESIHARKPGSVQDQAGSEGLFAGQPVIPAASSGQPTVLVVEDNADNMVTMEAILGNRFRIIPAVNGEDGLRLAAEFRPDLILLDMALPGLDGMAVAARLKADPGLRHIPVIALTAQAMKGDRERILAAGCEDYLSKPIDPERLLRVIDKRFKG
jgi:signal transduction histidine kinase/response regulator RpfG family c-di-GMP phosphodiesterase